LASRGRLHRHIVVRSLAAGSKQTEHLVIEIGNGNALSAAVSEVRGVDAHAGAGFAIVLKATPASNGHFLERAIAVVAIELVGLRVVATIRSGSRPGRNQAAATPRDFELLSKIPLVAVTSRTCRRAIVEEPAGLSAIGFGRAIGLVFAVQTAEHVVLGRPLHVVADEKIEAAIAVVVETTSRTC